MTTTTLLAAPSPTAGGAHPRGGSRTSVSLVLAVAGGLATESVIDQRPNQEVGSGAWSQGCTLVTRDDDER